MSDIKNVWQIGVDNVPRDKIGGRVFLRRAGRSVLIGEAMLFHAGQFFVQYENNEFDILSEDPRVPVEPVVPEPVAVEPADDLTIVAVSKVSVNLAERVTTATELVLA